MKRNEIVTLKKTFDDYKHVDENGVEYWNAHELSKAMGYSQYQQFKNAIGRAKDQMIATGKNPDNHLIRSNEMVEIGSGAIREVDGYIMDSYAAHSVAMNADPSKTEVAFAQQYFLDSTAKMEHIEKRINDKKYIDSRNELKAINSSLKDTLRMHDVKDSDIGIVFDAGDQGFFDMHTREVKQLAGIPDNKPVADIMGARMVAYKTVAQYNTEQEIINQNAQGVNSTAKISFDENRAIREMIQNKYNKNPEHLITGEDIKKVEKRYNRKVNSLEKKLEEESSELKAFAEANF